MDLFIVGCIAFIFGLVLNTQFLKSKKVVKTYNLKKKYKFAKKYDCFVIKEYEDNSFELVYYNKQYSEDFAE